jgi:hypothetical protein
MSPEPLAPELQLVGGDEGTFSRLTGLSLLHSHFYNRIETPEEEPTVPCAGFAEF